MAGLFVARVVVAMAVGNLPGPVVQPVRRRDAARNTRLLRALENGRRQRERTKRLPHSGLDAHVPFFGTYEVEGLQVQRLGLMAPAPQLQ